ncbi:hypothetical protein Tco_0992329 [Tanacetum coccineum]|uniref:Retrotransposon gag domain-containing protein n=1 Tax=Tanacetum coccineum TaxID=301880 RepID=A0ABQ5F206_9ASTR
MDALEKKFDEGIGKLDERIGTMKLEVDKKFEEIFEELKQLILGRGFRWEFGVDPQAAVDREMQHMIGTNQKGEREHRGTGMNQAGDGFAYHGFEHRMRKLKISMFEGEDAYGWIYRVEWYFEIQGLPQQEQLRAAALCMEGEALSWYRWSEGRTSIRSWDGFKRRLLIRF